jgi:integrase
VSLPPTCGLPFLRRSHPKLWFVRRLRSSPRTGLWQDHGLVFASEAGTLINPTNLRRRHFASLLKRAGLPADTGFHDLRHTCATLLLGKGVHPKFVQELLGHANTAITLDTYSHVIPSMGDATARAMEDALEGDQPEVRDAEDS